MQASLVLQGLTLLCVFILSIVVIVLWLKLRESLNNPLNEEIYRILSSIRERLLLIEKDFENKILEKITGDLVKTKEDLVNNLLKLKDTVHETTRELSSKNDSLSSETKQKLTELESKINKTISEVTQSLNASNMKIVTDVKNTIQEVNKQFIEQTNRLSEKLGTLDQKLSVVEKISSEIQSLQDILKPPKQRGILGEVMLENLLKEVFPRDMYEFQYSMGTDKVDAVLKLDGKILPIDSKFPLENYIKVVEKGGDIRALVRDVKNMIDSISSKYIKPAEYNTTNFAFMYIPAESVWYSLFVMNPSVFRYALEKKVFPVSPNTLMSYLLVIMEGARAYEIEENLESLMRELNSICHDIEGCMAEMETFERHARNSLNRISSLRARFASFTSKVSSLKEV
ncbi:DNA anti-recombination protein (rearrangement mutator) RmuC [Desulfurobacterium pacificum]|uniref:DNA anti-recombination protein (Rearrangement mutator) RmuC n=1 Tax=Desulfurobacterium pacificum TaxID=240166 RepID=A0ABY1NHH1_9BACT|nr:DNA recombination protein RmuC [Desulfurobacterium pacificum]SMP08983.1 DNA anti-recombination protein (rearrangement mutator) RmuC [Desulfurobacterium pacificum]